MLRPQPPMTTTTPPVMYSQQWSPVPSTTASAFELRTQKRSPARPFAMFESAVGHRFATALVLPSPFPSASRHFWRPGDGMLRPARFAVLGEEPRWFAAQAELIAATVRLNPRRLTLVISMSKEENRDAMGRLLARLPELEHVPFEEQRRFDELCASDRRGVVYGCESLGTGVDLPGLVGLVVILKPLTLSCSADETYARDHLNRAREMWDFYYWKSDYRFRQASGRLVRSPDDAGVILFFDLLNHQGTGPRGKEAAAVQPSVARIVGQNEGGPNAPADHTPQAHVQSCSKCCQRAGSVFK